MIEAGDSGSLNQLLDDMRWWFSISNHDVKIVLLAKFDRRQETIVLQKWEEEAAPGRTGATATRNTPALQPVLRQEISITRNETNPPSYSVTSGALVLKFQLLFLRDPTPREGDIIFDVSDLRSYADCIWESLEAE